MAQPTSPKKTSGQAPSVASLESLPAEIQDQIFSYLPQGALHVLLTSNSALTEAAAIAIYRRPRFASTYRFAQFVTTVSHSILYAAMVRVLDLSGFNHKEMKNVPLAGWREWRMRSEPLYALTDQAPEPSWHQDHNPLAYSVSDPAQSKSTHPEPHRFLIQLTDLRDIPLGGILHVLKACANIKEIDLSKLPLASDYALPVSVKYPVTAHTGLLFVSDVSKAWTWTDTDHLKPLSERDLARGIAWLPLMETIRIRETVWPTTEDVKIVLNQSRNLQKVDFTGSGWSVFTPWAVEGLAEVVRSVLDAEVQ